MDEKPQDDMGFLDYISKTKTRAPAPKLTQLNLDLSTPTEETLTARAPQLQSTVQPTVDPVAPILPKATTPKIAPLNLQTETYTVPTLPTAPKLNLDITALPVSQEVKPSPVQQSQVAEMDYVPPPQQTSPSQADKAFSIQPKTVPSVDSKVLTLPPEWSQKDLDKAKEIAKKYDMTVPEIFGIFGRETGDTYSASTTNEDNATGIFQLVPKTAADLLLSLRQNKAVAAAIADAKARKLTPEEEKKNIYLARKSNPTYLELSSDRDRAKARAEAQKQVQGMTIAQQLELKDVYLQRATRGKKGVENVYSSVFKGNPNEILVPQGTLEYEKNKSLDKDKKGGITKAEWMAPVLERARAIKDVRVQTKAEQPKAVGLRYDPDYSGRTVTPADQEALYKEAAAIAALADPTIPRSKINDVVKNVPLEVTYAGTPAQEYLKTAATDGGTAAGLWWPKKGKYGEERIQITSSIPRPIQANVLAHEIGHSLGKDDVNAPGELRHFDGNLLVPGGRATGVRAAFTEGKRKLDTDFATKEKAALQAASPWAPEWLVDSIISQSMPSGAVDLKQQKDTSGESPLASKGWDVSAPKKKKKK